MLAMTHRGSSDSTSYGTNYNNLYPAEGKKVVGTLRAKNMIQYAMRGDLGLLCLYSMARTDMYRGYSIPMASLRT